MPKNDINKLILSEVQALAAEMKEVRQKDIPNLRVTVAGFNEKIKTVQKQQTWFSSISTVVGGALVYALSMLTGHR